MASMNADWFERLTGFKETGYQETRAKLAIEGEELVSKVNGRRYGIGRLELVKLRDMRRRVRPRTGKRTTLDWVAGDVRKMHAKPQFAGALFQVASQFNLLEMIHEEITPEHGVTRYDGDKTQGPACAIAAGAATIYRNYFVPVGDQIGQTAERQIDALADMGKALGARLGRRVDELWQMQNGYALGTARGLDEIAALLVDLPEEERDQLRGELAVGLHRDAQVTDVEHTRVTVSQAFCSALPVAYCEHPAEAWASFARLVLEAAYETTLLAAAEQSAQGGSRVVLLTRLGGSAFGNDEAWITDAIKRALRLVEGAGLDVRFVCFSGLDQRTERMLHWWNNGRATD